MSLIIPAPMNIPRGLIVLTLLCALSIAAPRAQRLPNFIIVFADDLGYADIGTFSTVKGALRPHTPNLDRMAAEGIRLTSFYVAQAVCSASRAALLTGAYPNRVGIQGALNHTAQHGLNPDEMTIAEVLKQRGYATAIYGKWHLGHQKPFLPLRQGFDEYYGLPYSNDMWPRHPQLKDFFPDLPLIEGDDVLKLDPDQSQLTASYTDRAVSFIERHRNTPFFLYVPHTMPHVPLFVSDKAKGTTKGGVYGDVVAEIDWSVGRILEAVKRANLDNDTLVIFTSDNGPWMSYGNHAGSPGPFRESKGTSFEGGVRVAVRGALARAHSQGRGRGAAGDDDRPAADAGEARGRSRLDGTHHRRTRHVAAPGGPARRAGAARCALFLLAQRAPCRSQRQVEAAPAAPVCVARGGGQRRQPRQVRPQGDAAVAVRPREGRR